MDGIQEVLAALADPTRRAVFDCISGCGGQSGYDAETGICDAGDPGGVALCEVKCRVPCSPSTLTHHLNTLRDAGLITTEKRGRMVYAAIIPARLEALAAYFHPASIACADGCCRETPNA